MALIRAAVCALLACPALADESSGLFDQVLINPAVSLDDRCQNLAVTDRIRQWRDRNLPDDPFKSVSELREDVLPEALRQSVALGCEEHYYWAFMVCSQLDTSKSTLLVPTGKHASTDAELLTILQDCLEDLASQGISPTRAAP